MTTKKKRSPSSSSSVRIIHLLLQFIISLSVVALILTLWMIQSQLIRTLPALAVPYEEEPFLRHPKVTLLFLAREGLPLDFIWHLLFLKVEEGSFSIYVHSRSGFVFDATTPKSRFFVGWQIENSVKVLWGEAGMIKAERILLGKALEDPANQWFVFSIRKVIMHSQVKASLSIYDAWLDLQAGFVLSGKDNERPTLGFFPIVISSSSRAGLLFSLRLVNVPEGQTQPPQSLHPIFCSWFKDEGGGDVKSNIKYSCEEISEVEAFTIHVMPCGTRESSRSSIMLYTYGKSKWILLSIGTLKMFLLSLDIVDQLSNNLTRGDVSTSQVLTFKLDL